MAEEIRGKKVAQNMILSVTAQAVSMLVGFVINLIVPKFISEYDYSYWQTYLLYSQYVCFFQFGLLDGFILKYSKYDYNELDKDLVRSQFLSVLMLDFVIMLVIAGFGLLHFTDITRVITVLIAVTIPTEVAYNYVSFMFQSTNRIKEYTKYIIVYRVIYCVAVVLFLFISKKYYWFCLAYIFANVIAEIYFGLKYSRELFVGKILPFNKFGKELKNTISVGIWLMLSSYAANLVIGSGKMIIQWCWDTLTFGKVSLAFSLSSFVLQFVTAISVVLFPSIKRMNEDKLPNMYVQIRSFISPLFFIVLILYYPGSVLLKLWLPNYANSVTYLGILMPIIIYTSKVSLLTNNYLKAYRKERQLLIINVAVVVFAFIAFLICGYVIKSIELMLILIVAAIMIRSIISEIAVMRIIKVRLIFDFILEAILTIIFILCTMLLSRWIACLVYAIALVIYLIIKRDTLKPILGQVKNVLHR